MNKGFLIVALGLLAYYYNRKAVAAKSLLTRYLLPQQIKIRTGAVTFTQPVVVTNPSNTAINLQRYNVQVQIERYPVGLAYSVNPVTILPGQETTLQATVTIPLDALISVVPDLLKAGKALDFRFQGTITADNITVPIDSTVSIPIPKLNF